MKQGNRQRCNKGRRNMRSAAWLQKGEKCVWGVWLHIPAEAIRGSSARMPSFTLIWSGVDTNEQTKRAYPPEH